MDKILRWPPLEVAVIFCEIRSDVIAAIAMLPEHLQQAVFLTHWEDQTAVSVAECLGVSDRTVRRWLGEAHVAIGLYLVKSGWARQDVSDLLHELALRS